MKFLLFAFLSFALCINLITAAVTEAEFNLAVTSCGYPKPNVEIYESFSNATSEYSREEQAMFLAQIIHESGGFQFVEELACRKNKCKGEYVSKHGVPGKQYYGRGYIQLTWAINYKTASEALGMGDELLKNPDLVASDKRIAMLVSTWFWEVRVRPLFLKKHPNWFGVTTKAINGGECTNPSLIQRAVHRWDLYKKVAAAWNIKNVALEYGCYN